MYLWITGLFPRENDQSYAITGIVRMYLDNLLIILSGTYDNHLKKFKKVLTHLQLPGIYINVDKSSFVLYKIEYLGYTLTRDGIKPQPEKVSAILALQEPISVKVLCRFLGMVQYYHDIWEKRSHIIAPLTDLVGECGHAKVTQKNNTKNRA